MLPRDHGRSSIPTRPGTGRKPGRVIWSIVAFSTTALAVAGSILMTACGGPARETDLDSNAPPDGGAVIYRTFEISAESSSCDSDPDRCARVSVTSLETAGGGTDAARDNIDLFLTHDLVSRLRGFVPEEVGGGATRPDELAGAFLAQHRAFVAEFPDASAAWFIDIDTRTIHNTPVVTTIDIVETSSTGGAHPNSRRRLASFDVVTGQLLGVEELTTDTRALRSRVEQRFRSDRGLGPDDDLEEAGFWFPEGEFFLPDNVGVVEDGVVFHWDAYEIAPYSMGPTDVTVARSEIEQIVDRPFW